MSRGRVDDEAYALLEGRICGKRKNKDGKIVGHDITPECTAVTPIKDERVAVIVPHRHEADIINRQFTPQTEAQRKEKGARIYTSKTASPSNIVSSHTCDTVMHSQGIHGGDERKDSEADRQRLPMRTLRKDIDAVARNTRETHVLEATLHDKCVYTTHCV